MSKLQELTRARNFTKFRLRGVASFLHYPSYYRAYKPVEYLHPDELRALADIERMVVNLLGLWRKGLPEGGE